MKRIVYIVLLFCLVGVSLASELSRSHKITAGEVIALQLPIYADVYWRGMKEGFDNPVYSIYNKESGKIEMVIYGNTSDVKEASFSVLYYRIELKKFISFMKDAHGIEIAENEFRVTYRNRLGGMKEIYIDDCESEISVRPSTILGKEEDEGDE